MDLSWTKPTDDGGSKITDYVVEIKPEDGDWIEAVEVPATQTSAKVPKLKEGGKYQFRVRAKNAAGDGKPSRPTSSVTAENQPSKSQLVPIFSFIGRASLAELFKIKLDSKYFRNS